MEDAASYTISDTAHWVAVYRARESTRPDALFRDPLAERLAGARGQKLASETRAALNNGWPVVVRTKLIDDLVLAAVAESCDVVINLAAGLDTRPYRLELPRTLTWYEVDLAPVLETKTRLLGNEKPRCQLVRETVDLSAEAGLREFLARAMPEGSRALVIAEGLLPYLEERSVRALVREVRARSALHALVVDVVSPAVLAMLVKGIGSKIGGDALRFAPEEGIAFFERHGFRVRDVRAIFGEAVRLGRAPLPLRLLGRLLPEPNPRKLGKARWSVVLHLAPEAHSPNLSGGQS